MFFLAIRHLFSRKKQSTLIFLGIVLGTAAFVGITGMMLGFRVFIINQLVNNDGHVRISSREEYITPAGVGQALYGDHELVHWIIPPSGRRDSQNIEYLAGWIERLNASPLVAAYAPQLVIQGILRRGDITESVRIVGVEPEKQKKVTTIGDYMVDGDFSDMGSTGSRLIVGEGLLQNLGARVSENLLLSTGTGEPTTFQVVGSFRLGVKNIDDSTAYAPLADLQRVNRTPSQVSDIVVRLGDVERAAEIATSWASTSPDKVLSWDQANESILSVFRVQDLVRFFMTISILAVAGFGIYNVLNMMVNQKQREIAILRSIGFEPKDVLHLFLIQGLLLGLVGGALGDLLGFVICKYMSTLQIGPARELGTTGKLLISFAPDIYVRGFLLAFAASAVASVLPARAASKLSPIQIIRSAE